MHAEGPPAAFWRELDELVDAVETAMRRRIIDPGEESALLCALIDLCVYEAHSAGRSDLLERASAMRCALRASAPAASAPRHSGPERRKRPSSISDVKQHSA